MYLNFNRFEDRPCDPVAFDEREDFRGCGMRGEHGPHGCHRGYDAFRCGPRGFGPGGPGFPPHGMPPFGGPGGPGGPGRPGCPGGPGFPPHGMPPFGGPRRPNPEFLQRRLDEADLSELLVMAGRMLRRRPQGGPAQGQALILSILAGREAISQRELQQMLGIQPGSLSELVSKLEAKGFVTREKAEDRRGNLLRITDAGRAAIPAASDAPEDDPFAPLTTQQQDELAAMLRALLARWIEQLEPPCPRGRGPQEPAEV